MCLSWHFYRTWSQTRHVFLHTPLSSLPRGDRTEILSIWSSCMTAYENSKSLDKYYWQFVWMRCLEITQSSIWPYIPSSAHFPVQHRILFQWKLSDIQGNENGQCQQVSNLLFSSKRKKPHKLHLLWLCGGKAWPASVLWFFYVTALNMQLDLKNILTGHQCLLDHKTFSSQIV